MQPAQLSLLPDHTPALPMDLLALLPEPHVAAAIAELARLIAQAATATSEGAGDG